MQKQIDKIEKDVQDAILGAAGKFMTNFFTED